MLDYATLKIIWWVLVGVLLVGFAIMDGHDMGVGTLLPFAGRNDEERRVVIRKAPRALPDYHLYSARARYRIIPKIPAGNPEY